MNDVQEEIMGELCVRLGFCLLPENTWDWFAAQSPDTPEAFARTVWLGEGMDYDKEPREGLKTAVMELGARYLAAS